MDMFLERKFVELFEKLRREICNDNLTNNLANIALIKQLGDLFIEEILVASAKGL